MSEEFKEGDVILLTNTKQEAEVLEVINVIDGEHHGPLLRVNLLGAIPPMIQYYPVRSVQLVRAAADDPSKKAKHEKKPEHEKKLAHEEKTDHHDKKTEHRK